MRVFAVLALAVMMACSLVTPSVSFGGSDADVSGKWTGSWVGTGLFNSVRQENLTLDLTQSGDAGYGRLVIDNAIAAESVPWQVRQQGLAGIRVFAEISGGKVKLMYEQDKRVFTADLKVMGDQMVGTVRGSNVRMILTRESSGPAPQHQQSAQVAPPPPSMASRPALVEPTPAAATEPEPTVVAMAPTPEQQESTEAPKADDPAQQQQRPRQEDFVAAPELKAVHFDFDKALLRADAVDALSSNAAWLKENVDTLVLIEGNCDEKGTAEYNMALGDRRARAAMDYLEANGIAKDRMTTISYGKERPACSENTTEECMKQNRRTDFKVKSR